MGNLLLAKSRIGILVTVIFGVLIIFACQLVRVQIIQAGAYQEKAAFEMKSTRVIPAQRGEITDVNGVSFARSVSAINIVVDQTQITDPKELQNLWHLFLDYLPKILNRALPEHESMRLSCEMLALQCGRA